MRSFEHARRYAPGILGASQRFVSEELLDAYRKQRATRTLQRLLKAREHLRVPANCIEPGLEIISYYDTTGQN